MRLGAWAPARAVDVTLAVFAGVVTQLDVWGVTNSTEIVGPRLWLCVFWGGASIALLFRRSHPAMIFASFCGGWVATMLAFGASEHPGAVIVFVSMIYAVGRYEPDRRRALLLLVLGGVVLVIHDWTDPQVQTLADLRGALPYDVIALSGWLVGAYVRYRRLYVASVAGAAATAERTRIARELHDVIAHSVGVIVVQAEAAEEVLASEPERARLALHVVQETGRQALAELSRSIGMLRDGGPVVDGPQPGLADLGNLVSSVRSAGLRVAFRQDGDPRPLDPGLDLAAYRIVQEALTNVLKHAGPAEASVRVCYEPGAVQLEVRDDGRGPGPGPSGHGLTGMRERAAAYGGVVRAGPAEGGGFLVQARLPIRAST